MSPPSLLLLLLALTACLAETEEPAPEEGTPKPFPDTSTSSEDNTANNDDPVTNDNHASRISPGEENVTTLANYEDDVSKNDTCTSCEKNDEEGLSPVFILIPVVLGVVILMMIVGGIIINRRWKRNKSNSDHNRYHEDKYLHDNGTEKVPMPMFEDDVPSVLELEMEDLEQWMNKDSGVQMDSGQGM